MDSPEAPVPVEVNKWPITIAVMLGTIMELMDTTVVNVALPHIAGSLAAGVDESTWVLTSYLVSNAIVMPTTSWLARVFGRKRFFMLCLGLFTVSSMICGAAPSLGILIFFRVFQGIGGGALQPISQAILLETFPVNEAGMAMAIYGMGAITAPILGPLVGGWITDNLTWRWAFYINLPVGVLCLIMVKVFIFDPDYLRRRVAPRIDYLGLGLLILGIGALQIMLDKGEREDWFSSVFIVRLALISAVCLIILVYWELKTRHPFVNLRLFKDRNYSVGLLIFFFFRFVLYGSMVLLPLFLQIVMGYDATLAGMVMAWGGVSAFLIMPVVGRLSSRVDNRLLAIVGLAIGALATYLLSLYNTQIDFATAAWPRFIQGLGAGIAFVSLTNLTMGHLPREIMGDATGIYNLLRNLGGSFGIAVATTFLSRRSQFHQVRLVEHLTPFSLPFNEWRQHIAQIIPGLTPRTELWHMPQALTVLYQQMQAQSQTLAFADVYWLFTLLFLVLIPLVLFMRHHWTAT